MTFLTVHSQKILISI